MSTPKSLSASAVQTYEACPSRWVAEYIHRAANFSSSAADLGTVCHSALERYVADGHYLTGDLSALKKWYEVAYFIQFEDSSRFDEGWAICERWYARTSFAGRTVLSTETKTNFVIKTSAGEIPFNYIWDRCDRIDNEDGTFDIEVVDYKTSGFPMSPDKLRDKVQARCYGVAAQIAFPEARRIWVTFDLLRFDAVGVRFDRDDNVATWKYIKAVAERMIATDDDNAPERINDTCKWCVRKQACAALISHTNVGGVAGVTDAHMAAERRAKASNAVSGLKVMIEELDQIILDHCEAEDILEFETTDFNVNITARATRTIDPGRAADVLGPDLMAKYGSMTMKSVDALLKGTELTREQRDELNALIGKKFGEASVKITEKNPIDD